MCRYNRFVLSRNYFRDDCARLIYDGIMSITYVHILAASSLIYLIMTIGSVRIGWSTSYVASRNCGFFCVRYHKVSRFCKNFRGFICAMAVAYASYYFSGVRSANDHDASISSLLVASIIVARAVENRVRVRMRLAGCAYLERQG